MDTLSTAATNAWLKGTSQSSNASPTHAIYSAIVETAANTCSIAGASTQATSLSEAAIECVHNAPHIVAKAVEWVEEVYHSVCVRVCGYVETLRVHVRMYYERVRTRMWALSLSLCTCAYT